MYVNATVDKTFYRSYIIVKVNYKNILDFKR